MTFSSVSSGNRAKSSSPAAVFAARSFRYADFCLDNPDAPQLRIAQLENALRSQRFTRERCKAFEDRHRRLAVQLLVDNRLGQAAKLRQPKLHAARPHPLNNGTQDRIALFQMVYSLSHALALPQKYL